MKETSSCFDSRLKSEQLNANEEKDQYNNQKKDDEKQLMLNNL